jgi:hypothetical protein
LGSGFIESGVPDTDPDPAFQVNPDPYTDPGFDDQKLKEKKIQLKNFCIFFFKIAIYLCPIQSYRRSLQPSK